MRSNKEIFLVAINQVDVFYNFLIVTLFTTLSNKVCCRLQSIETRKNAQTVEPYEVINFYLQTF